MFETHYVTYCQGGPLQAWSRRSSLGGPSPQADTAETPSPGSYTSGPRLRSCTRSKDQTRQVQLRENLIRKSSAKLDQIASPEDRHRPGHWNPSAFWEAAAWRRRRPVWTDMGQKRTDVRTCEARRNPSGWVDHTASAYLLLADSQADQTDALYGLAAEQPELFLHCVLYNVFQWGHEQVVVWHKLLLCCVGHGGDGRHYLLQDQFGAFLNQLRWEDGKTWSILGWEKCNIIPF